MNRTLLNYRLLPKTLTVSCIVAAIATGCAPAQRLLSLRPQIVFDRANLSIQVVPASKPGEYTVSGAADLPEGTELTVAAIRYLHLSQSSVPVATAKPTYSILAYDVVEIVGDRWQTQLPLWKVAPDGTFQETWQLNESDLALAVEPEERVLFLATLAPIHNLQEIERQLAAGNQRFASRFIQTTAEGSRYLQTSEMVALSLPTGATTALEALREDGNGGWGNLYLPLPDPPNPHQLEFPGQRQTNAPASQGELLY